MKKESSWEVGKTYRTKGGLYATITRIYPRAIPKELSAQELEELMSRPHFGLEGYVTLPSNPNQKMRGAWTLNGLHSLDPKSDGTGDLTLTEVTHATN